MKAPEKVLFYFCINNSINHFLFKKSSIFAVEKLVPAGGFKLQKKGILKCEF